MCYRNYCLYTTETSSSATPHAKCPLYRHISAYAMIYNAMVMDIMPLMAKNIMALYPLMAL